MSGNNNEAQIIISTDYESFKEFVEYGKKGLGDFSGKGKSAFGEMGKEAKGAFAAVKNEIAAMGNEISRAFVGPMNVGFDQMIQKAERLRDTAGRLAVSTGLPEGQAKELLKQKAAEAKVKTEDMEGFVGRFRSATGDVKAGINLFGVAREAGLRLNRTPEEMAGVSATLFQKMGLRSEDAQRAFFNNLYGSAERKGCLPSRRL